MAVRNTTVRTIGEVGRRTPVTIDPVSAAEEVLRLYGARAVTLLTAGHQADDGRWVPARLSPNDCYVALDEACRKVARVALRKYEREYAADGLAFGDCLAAIFPDPAAYLARAIKSVISDEGRSARREVPVVSLDTPIGSGEGVGLSLADTVAETRSWRMPEASLIESDEKARFRGALGAALKGIPANYLAALKRDMDRERERQAGAVLEPESARERQTVCRARAALSEIIRRECGDDNPYVRLLAQQRSSRVRRKVQPVSAGVWTGERQETLFRKLMQTGWAQRAAARPDGGADEAVVNDVTRARDAAPPSPEMRQAMRVVDLYTVDYPTPQGAAARELYERARSLRQAGKLEEALRHFRATYEAEPTFIEALNNVGNMHSQLGNLRDALRVFLSIVERNPAGDHKYMAATNAANIYLTWYDAGRSRERNIELATQYARLAMERPTPMRACNLILAYAKDRYFDEARQVMNDVLNENSPRCPSERFLQTLFQIRDPDLVTWWTWLEGEMGKE